MFPISWIKTLDKLSFVLVAPLVTIAILVDCPSLHTAEFATIIGWLGGLVWAFIVGVVGILVVDFAIVYLDTNYFEDYVLSLAGMLFLAFCLYGTSNFYRQLPPSPFNPAWHLAAGCYGFTLFKRNVLAASARKNGDSA